MSVQGYSWYSFVMYTRAHTNRPCIIDYNNLFILYINVFVHLLMHIIKAKNNFVPKVSQRFCEVPNLDTILAQLDKEVGICMYLLCRRPRLKYIEIIEQILESNVSNVFSFRPGFCFFSSRTWVKLSLDTNTRRTRPTRPVRFPRAQSSLERQWSTQRVYGEIRIKMIKYRVSDSLATYLRCLPIGVEIAECLHAFALICRPKWQDQKKNPRKPYYDHYDPHFSEEQPEQSSCWMLLAKTPCMSSAKKNNHCQSRFKLFLICQFLWKLANGPCTFWLF